MSETATVGVSVRAVFDVSTFEHRYEVYAALPERRR